MDTQKIGGFLATLRKSKGLTQQGLADIFNVSNKTVSKWECGDAIPEITVLMAIANFYQVTVDEILQGERKSSVLVETPLSKPERKKSYHKCESQLKIYSLISYALLLISISLMFIFAGPRPGLAFGIGIPLFIISISLFFIGVTLSRNQASDELDKEEQRRFNIQVYKMVYIFLNIIGLLLLFILQLQSMRGTLNLTVSILTLIGSPLYYYYLKERIYDVPAPDKVKSVIKWIRLIKPVYVITTLVVVYYVFFTPLYEVAHYYANNPTPTDQVIGSFINIISLRPNLYGLYLFAFIFILGISFAVFAYIKKKSLSVSYFLQAAAVLGVFLALYRQYLVDYKYFRHTYDSVNSSLTTFLPFVFTFACLGVAHFSHWLIVYFIDKKKKTSIG